MAYAVFDTSVYIDHWERGLHAGQLAQLARGFVIRQSAVVLSELRRGARSKPALRLVDALRRLAPVIWEPSSEDWWKAGELIRSVGDAHDWEVSKRREFQNDALIALTALRHGATVVTTNAADFRLLSRRTRVRVVVI